MQDYHNLRAWWLAKDLATLVIESLPLKGPGHATGIRGQAIRAAQSIGANLAEGCGRSKRSEFLQFIEFAQGSAAELESHLATAREAEMLDPAIHDKLRGKLVVLGKMLRALHRAVQHAIALEQNKKRSA